MQRKLKITAFSGCSIVKRLLIGLGSFTETLQRVIRVFLWMSNGLPKPSADIRVIREQFDGPRWRADKYVLSAEQKVDLDKLSFTYCAWQH